MNEWEKDIVQFLLEDIEQLKAKEECSDECELRQLSKKDAVEHIKSLSDEEICWQGKIGDFSDEAVKIFQSE